MAFETGNAVEFLVTRQFILGYCAVLVVIFLFFLVRFWIKYQQIFRDIKRARKVLDKVSSREEFFKHFRTINEEFSKSRSLSHSWDEFTESLVFPAPNDPQIIRNTKEPSAHFDVSSIIEPHINVRGYNAIPNYLTGLGILGTFIGLAAGIHLASPYLTLGDAGDTQDMIEGLSRLLNGASLAFITSIAGLSTSIIFLFSERSWLSRLSREISRFVASLDRVLELATPAKLANDQLGELKKQSLQLQQFNTDLATSIASALDEKLAGRMGPAIDRLVETMEGLRADRVTSTDGLIESVSEQIQEALTGATSREISAMAGTLGELNRSLQSSVAALAQRDSEVERSLMATGDAIRGAMTESMSTVQREISRSMGDLTTRLEESSDLVGTSFREAGAEATRSFGSAMGALSTAAAEKLHSVLEGLERSSEQLSNSISKAGQHAISAVDRSAERLAEQSGQSERILATTSATLQRLEALLDTAGQTEAGFREITPQVLEASREFALTAERTRESLEAIQGLSRTMSDTSSSLSETQTQVREAWNDYIERFQSTDASLKRVFEQVDLGLEHFITRISEFNQSFDGHLSSSVNMLGGAVKELGEILEDNLGPAVEQGRA